MDRFVVVGMRYQKPSAVNDVIKQFKEGNPVQLILRGEPNNHASKGTAVAVHYSVSATSSIRVGYIREKDLQDALSYINKHVRILSYTPNYWVVEILHDTTTPNNSSISCNTASCSKPLNTNKVPTKEDLVTADAEAGQFIINPKLYTCSKFSHNESNKMNTNNIRDSFFREVKNVAIDIQTGKFGVLSNEGLSVYTGEGISVNPITELGVKIPAFALRVAVKDLKEGDIVISGNESSFFKCLTESGYEVVNLSGEVKQVGSVTNMFFGKNSVLAVKNMFGEGTNPLMMALLMGDGKLGEGDNKNLMLAMAMSGGMGGCDAGGGMNPLMMMMLLGK